MKKLCIALLVAILPIMAFSQIQIGSALAYNPSRGCNLMLNDNGDVVYSGDTRIKVAPFLFSQMRYGVEMRLRLLNIIRLDTTVLGLTYGYTNNAGDVIDQFPALEVMPTAGLSLDILFARLGLSMGPDLRFSCSSDYPIEEPIYGWNLKGSLDINLGKLSVGLWGMYTLESLDDLSRLSSFYLKYLPWIGLTSLVRL